MIPEFQHILRFWNIDPGAVGPCVNINFSHGIGISLVVDLVFNHTSDEHEWAQKALAGSAEHQEYYRMFDNRERTEAWSLRCEVREKLLKFLQDHYPECLPKMRLEIERENNGNRGNNGESLKQKLKN